MNDKVKQQNKKLELICLFIYEYMSALGCWTDKARHLRTSPAALLFLSVLEYLVENLLSQRLKHVRTGHLVGSISPQLLLNVAVGS